MLVSESVYRAPPFSPTQLLNCTLLMAMRRTLLKLSLRTRREEGGEVRGTEMN